MKKIIKKYGLQILIILLLIIILIYVYRKTIHIEKFDKKIDNEVNLTIKLARDLLKKYPNDLLIKYYNRYINILDNSYDFNIFVGKKYSKIKNDFKFLKINAENLYKDINDILNKISLQKKINIDDKNTLKKLNNKLSSFLSNIKKHRSEIDSHLKSINKNGKFTSIINTIEESRDSILSNYTEIKTNIDILITKYDLAIISNIKKEVQDVYTKYQKLIKIKHEYKSSLKKTYLTDPVIKKVKDFENGNVLILIKEISLCKDLIFNFLYKENKKIQITDKNVPKDIVSSINKILNTEDKSLSINLLNNIYINIPIIIDHLEIALKDNIYNVSIYDYLMFSSALYSNEFIWLNNIRNFIIDTNEYINNNKENHYIIKYIDNFEFINDKDYKVEHMPVYNDYQEYQDVSKLIQNIRQNIRENIDNKDNKELIKKYIDKISDLYININNIMCIKSIIALFLCDKTIYKGPEINYFIFFVFNIFGGSYNFIDVSKNILK